MKLRDRITGAVDTVILWGASKLAPVAPPKVRPKQQSFPSHVRSVTPSDAVIRREDRQLANKDLLDYRVSADSRATIRDLAASSPDFAGATSAYLRVALTQAYKCWARNMDGTFNVDATNLANELLRRFDLVPNYIEDGFNQTASMRSLSEALGKQILHTGAMCFELVLDKARLPSKLVPISTMQIRFYEDSKGVRPVQLIGGQEIDLDFPAVFYTSLDQDLLTPYADSPFESAIQATLADAEYTQDLRRVLKRSIHPRLQAIIDNEMLRKHMPPEAINNPEKMAEYFNRVTAEVEGIVNGLAPEDALVALSYVEFSYVEGGTGDVPDVVKSIQSLLNAKMATGLKTLPSILGHGAGTQNMASSETLLFMKNADGVVRVKLNEMYSKALTLACRLFGLDVAVYFEYDSIELRPKGELEAFKSMEQARILEQLSYGFIEDEMASIMLTGHLPGPQFTPLSGTRFFKPDPATADGNPYSGTSTGSPGGDAATAARKPTTPTKRKGGQ